MVGAVVDVVDDDVVGTTVVDVGEVALVLVGPTLVVVLLGGASPGAGSLKGTGALAPPSTYTGVPLVTVL